MQHGQEPMIPEGAAKPMLNPEGHYLLLPVDFTRLK